MLYTIFMLLIIGLILFGIFNRGAGNSAAKALNLKFAAMGEIKGLSKADIISQVGPPSLIEHRDGIDLLEWSQGGYRAVMAFEDEICRGVVHQSMS